jgi:DNA-binding LytR/AlgR family response regulator
MKIAICDDEARCLERVREIAEAYVADRKDKRISVSYFSTPDDLLEESEKIGGFDVYVLDIIMPRMNGIELGTRLRAMGCDGKILYLTSSKEYALDSFKVHALNYLIKPIEPQPFYEALDEAVSLLQDKREKSILIKTKERSIKVSLDSILYAEIIKRAVVYHLTDGRVVESISMRASFSDSVAELLEDRRFVLCGPGTAVNLDHVTEVDNDSVTLGDTTVFAAKKSCRDLRLAWSEYLFSGGSDAL